MIKKADVFINAFKPYRNNYTYEYYNTLFHEKLWAESKKYLSENKILEGILGLSAIGYFLTNSTVILAIDIDDHSGKGEAYLLNLYNQVLQRIKIKPSIIFKSPRGLHLYYFLTEFVPTGILVNHANEKLKGIPHEIKPTENISLRFPIESKAINPENMQFFNMPFEKIIPYCQKYHPVELFDENILPIAIRESLKEKRQNIKKFKSIPKIEYIENQLLPFEDHNTNETFLKLCNIYRCSGLTIDEALYRFKLCLLRSPEYTGGLINYRELSRRVKSEYVNNQSFIPKKIEVDPNLFDNIIVNNIIKRSPFTYRRDKALKQFIFKLLHWIDFQDEILKDKKQLSLWDYMYPYYRKNRNEGLYPLPFNLMRKWNHRYFEILDFLLSIGLLENSNYKYNPMFNICKYYKVKTESFLNS